MEKPWLKFYGNTPETIDYPKVTLYERFTQTVEKYPDAIAWEFVNNKSTYKAFQNEIDRFANGLVAMGMKQGDVITISMPTSPQGLIALYAVNKIGGICSMIHPQTPGPQIETYLKMSKSKYALTLDAFFGSFKDILAKGLIEKLILTRIPDYLKGIMKTLFKLTKGKKIPPVPADPKVVWFLDILNKNAPPAPKSEMKTDDLAIILYSGGTTGTPKGIMLSSMNFIAEGMEVASWADFNNKDRILAILPIFHGFGLGVCCNAIFMGGGTSILIPQFTPADVAKLIVKRRPTLVIGVPTLFDALSREPAMQNADLSCLRATFCGADTLPKKVKEAFEDLVKKNGGNVQLLEGYGLTEAVTAIMAMPLGGYREGSVGIPFPDILAKIVQPGTEDEMPFGEEGEICISGPAVMLGYLDNPEETEKALRVHADGLTWLHTGDICSRDDDGYFYFKLRLKRMLKVSGFNVYPAQLEELISSYPDVDTVCVIGIPDRHSIERVKVFVVLKDKSKATDETKEKIIKFCQENRLKQECPRELEFRDSLPKTLIGKIAFHELEKEELVKLEAAGEYPFDGSAPAEE